MKPTGVGWRGFGVPFNRSYLTSETRSTTRYGLLLFLHTDTGVVGVGEASPVGAGSWREVKETATQLEGLASQLLGMGLSTWELGQDLPSFDISPALRFGLETALLDLSGKAKECSVVELLRGGSHPVSVNALISAETPQEVLREAQEAVALGFTSLKLKVALGTLEEDETLVSSIRGEVGTGVRLRIDPNQGWSVSQAIDAIHRLALYNLEYVEQPVPGDDLAGLREVRRAVQVPIAVDEALGSVDDLRRLVEADAADLLVLKAGRLGGFHASMEVIRLAEEEGIPVVVTSSLESGVGLAASLALTTTLASHPFAHGLATGLLLENDLVFPHIVPSGGVLIPPQGPGLGIEVDTKALDKYGINIKGWVGS